jgi:hypothetical protein
MKARIADFSMTFAGKQRLTFELDGDFRPQYDELKDQAVELTVKRFRQKRSLDANAYAWVIIDKIAQRMRLSKVEVYRDHIRHIGGVSETVCVQERAVDKLTEAWSKNGIGWQTETFPSKIPGCTNVTLYYGSSTYDTAQMSALIDALVQTAKSLGIETMPDEELKSLLKGR